MKHSLYDCSQIPVGPEGISCRMIVATHPAGKKSPIGGILAEVVYELYFTNLPQHAFTAAMWLSCSCIAVPLSLRSQTKTRRSIPTNGVAIRPGDKSASRWCLRWCLNESGTCVWNWDINCILIPSA